MLSEATSLVNYARENESALAMLTAVQMLERVQVQENAQRVGTKKSGPQNEGEQVKEGKKGTHTRAYTRSAAVAGRSEALGKRQC